MSTKIPGKTITYEQAFEILVSPTSPQGNGKHSMTYEEVSEKYKVSVELVTSIKNGTFLVKNIKYLNFKGGFINE